MYRENSGSSLNFKTNGSKRNSTKSGTQGACYLSPYSQRSCRMASSATRPSTKIHPSLNEDDSEHDNLEAVLTTKKLQFKSMQTQLLKKQDKLIKLHESLTKLHERILKLTGKDLGGVENIRIAEFYPMQENDDVEDEVNSVNGDHVLRHEDREKPQSEKTKAADEESLESKEEDDEAQSSKFQNDLNEEKETDSIDLLKEKEKMNIETEEGEQKKRKSKSKFWGRKKKDSKESSTEEKEVNRRGEDKSSDLSSTGKEKKRRWISKLKFWGRKKKVSKESSDSETDNTKW